MRTASSGRIAAKRLAQLAFLARATYLADVDPSRNRASIAQQQTGRRALSAIGIARPPDGAAFSRSQQIRKKTRVSTHMAFAKRNDFNDRREAAEKARVAMLERFKARPPADDPVVQAKQAERFAIAEAREKRRAEREAIRKAEEERIAAEKLTAELAELQRKEEEARRRAEAEALLEAARKAQRDLRYANRKSKKRR
jgi:hypothetical protein